MRSLSQRQLAVKLGCPRTWVSKLERQLSTPNVGTMYRLAHALNVPIWKIFKISEVLCGQ
jgi:transcriptional regulator with XRE-family HTH domain